MRKTAIREVKGNIMYLRELHIENYRLLKNVDLAFDKNLTLLVGKNNTGKTSAIRILSFLASDEKNLDLDDYPLVARTKLYSAIVDYWRDPNFINFQKSVPITKFRLTFDYSDDIIGQLDEFIIDLNENETTAIVEVSFDLMLDVETTLLNLKKQFNDLSPNIDDEDSRDKYIAQVVRDNYNHFFSMNIAAKNPSDPSDIREIKKPALQNLFNMKVILAERNMDESSVANDNPIGQIMKKLFNAELEDIETSLQPSVQELHKIVTEASFDLNTRINSRMETIVNNMMTFGYPSGEELRLQASTNLALEKRIIDDTELKYIAESGLESLPETHNGLGYKNLIKITMELQDYAQSLVGDSTRLPLLIIEEPEAHMHPQLQTTFVLFLNNFLDKTVEGNRIQVIMTTHSAHVANTVPFHQVRYVLKRSSEAVCKSMSDFIKSGNCTQNEESANENNKDQLNNSQNGLEESKKRLDFLQKYMKLSYCDLYFCDKAILVEGASERLLLPNMIEKCKAKGYFSQAPIPLTNQYYTIIEVGGAYAHNFFDLVDFLEIPTLIITDVDFVNSDKKRCQKEKAERSSNATINRWCKRKFHISEKVLIDKVYELEKDEQYRIEDMRRIEFQHEECNFHPRSLEEAIQNVNRSLFEKSNDEKLDFSKESIKKTDFALSLLMDDKNRDYEIPSYIREGLVWLNNQTRENFFKEASYDK